MTYKRLEVPFLGNESIKKAAEGFREEYWDDSLPVDIETIIDVKMGINVIPAIGLAEACDTEALISSNWESIYVDKERYLGDKSQRRMRFSFAHEIGHYVLHKGIYGSFNISSYEDFYQFYEEIPESQYHYLEIQANKFANYLLVPQSRLADEVKKIEQTGIPELDKIDESLKIPFYANNISSTFGVSAKVVEIAINDMNREAK